MKIIDVDKTFMIDKFFNIKHRLGNIYYLDLTNYPDDEKVRKDSIELVKFCKDFMETYGIYTFFMVIPEFEYRHIIFCYLQDIFDRMGIEYQILKNKMEILMIEKVANKEMFRNECFMAN